LLYYLSKRIEALNGNEIFTGESTTSLQFSLLLFLQPDYDDHDHDNSRLKPFPSSRGKEKSKDSKKYDDPYYCGLRARVPNFVAKSKTKDPVVPSKRFSISQQQAPPPLPMMHQHHVNPHHMHQHPMWHTRSFESGIGK
jgi:hypothetical protein